MFARTSVKSFDQTFSKVCAGGGREALLAPAGAKAHNAVFLVLFLRLLAQKKNENGLITQSPEVIGVCEIPPQVGNFCTLKNPFFHKTHVYTEPAQNTP
jgi:hypothetical protein